MYFAHYAAWYLYITSKFDIETVARYNIHQYSHLKIYSSFWGMVECKITTGLSACRTFTHTNTHTRERYTGALFFGSQRSGNSRRRRYRREIESFGWKFTAAHMATHDICICNTCTWHVCEYIYILFSIYRIRHIWNLMCTALVSKISIFSCQNIDAAVTSASYDFCWNICSWFTSKIPI